MSAVLEQPQSTHASYSSEYKARALAIVDSHYGNIQRAANDLGIRPETLRYWVVNKERFREVHAQKQAELADECEADARYYFALARDKAPDAPYNQLMTGAAIAVDKMQLLRGQPTSIANVNIGRVELTSLLSEALEAGLMDCVDGELLPNDPPTD